MVLALILCAAPVTVSLSADAVSVDGKAIVTSFEGDLLNLPEVNEALWARRTDAGGLEVRIDVVGAVPFLRLKRVLFASASAGARIEVRLEGAEPFLNPYGRGTSLGSIQLSSGGLWLGDLQLGADAGVLDEALLLKRLGPGPPIADRTVNIGVDDLVSTRTLAPVVEVCRRAGYTIMLQPLSVGSSPIKRAGAPASSKQEQPGVAIQEPVKNELIRTIINANRDMVRHCRETTLGDRSRC